MDEFPSRNGLRPSIGLLSSDGVEEIAAKNELSFADLLAPFCNVQGNINDPTGQSVPVNLNLSIRDIRRNGFLLSLTVLPSVLQESITHQSEKTLDSDTWSNGFKELFHHWAEPAEHDFLKCYVACIFAISSADADPVAELNNLVRIHESQLLGSVETRSTSWPSHCSAPKWYSANVLKFFVVVDDISLELSGRTTGILSSMHSTYGEQNCRLLRINSGHSAEKLNDLWSEPINLRMCGLESGIEAARRHLLSKSVPAQELSNLSVTSVSTNFHQNRTDVQTINLNYSKNPTKIYGLALSADDRKNVFAFVEDFVKSSLLPYAERTIMAQSELLVGKRSLGKSFSSMKKWLNVAAGAAQTSPNSTSGAYASESPEIQMRRLADLSFLFGLYSYSHQLYQTLKRDFLNDQAWLHHAGALEMAALSSFLSSNAVQLKSYPVRYMTKALEYYMSCVQPLLAVRCALWSAEILNYLNRTLEGANQLVQLAPELPDFYAGVLMERAATLFERGKMFRRKAFHLVLAGHRYEKSGLASTALKCYQKALPEYLQKKWDNAEDNILCVIVRDPKLDKSMRFDLCRKLIRPFCLTQSAEQQRIFLDNYLSEVQMNGSSFIIPELLSSLLEIRTEKELSTRICPNGQFEYISPPGSEWLELDRLCISALQSNGSCVSEIHCKNSIIFSASDSVTLSLKMRNPFLVPLTLLDVHLIGSEETSDMEFTSSRIESVTLPPIQPFDFDSPAISDCAKLYGFSDILLSFSLTSNIQNQSFAIEALKFRVCTSNSNTVVTSIPLWAEFQSESSLSQSDSQHNTKIKFKVLRDTSPQLSISLCSSPMVTIPETSTDDPFLEIYCSQVYMLTFMLKNTGSVDVKELSVAIDGSEKISVAKCCISISESKDEEMTNISNNVFKATNMEPKLSVGTNAKLQLAILVGSLPTNSGNIHLSFCYSANNGMAKFYRQKLVFRSTALLRSSVRVVDKNASLCVLHVENLCGLRDPILAQIEIISLSTVLKSHTEDIALTPLHCRNVVVDAEQSDSYCFIMSNAKKYASSVIEFVNDTSGIGNWASDHTSDLQFRLLWRARVTNGLNTFTTYGQTYICNPLLALSNQDIRSLSEKAVYPELLESLFLSRKAQLPFLPNIQFVMTPEELNSHCKEVLNRRENVDAKIIWSLDERTDG